MKRAVAVREQRRITESEHFISCMRSHCEQIWDEDAGVVPDDSGEGRDVTGRQLFNYLTVTYGSPEMRARFMREWEKALDGAGYLVAALADPKHGAGSREVRETLADLTEKLNALRVLTPYQREDGSLAI